MYHVLLTLCRGQAELRGTATQILHLLFQLLWIPYQVQLESPLRHFPMGFPLEAEILALPAAKVRFFQVLKGF